MLLHAEQGGSLGIVVSGTNHEPMADTKIDNDSASRALAFTIGWVLDPLVFGDYPAEIHRYLGSELPQFSKEEIDYTGMDGISVVPRGMEEIVDYVKERYNNIPMFITENDYSAPHGEDVTVKDILNDTKRIEFHKAYLAFLA
ncbi:putative inactive beta-glucosidase 14 [Apium graveolens]|uniref:putative inactive beta-glucosidase 14 n=1 Tax=Apium graveolens TaxID=4045 RepID=UPI003D7A6113